MRRLAFLLALVLAALGCSPLPRPDETRAESITVAAATNLADAFTEVGKQFTEETGIKVVLSFGSTAQLARQAEQGAPFDVFAAADREHVDALSSSGVLLPETCTVYARGRLALWIPKGDELGVRALSDLSKPAVRVIAVATPSAAPYGQAAVESLQAAGLWNRLEPKVVYANNIAMSKQFAETGNADAAFTAYSLVLREQGTVLKIEETLHKKLEQSLGVLKRSGRLASARRFREFVVGGQGQSVLGKYGYEVPD
jgi:molybdate transport system substrate-binding protein